MKKVHLPNVQRIHFIGIGGISMSGLAEVLLGDGYQITGSDATQTHITDRLQSIGVPVAIPNAPENIPPDTDLVVFTAAIRENNPEYQAAQGMGKPLMERAALLGKVIEGFPHTISVAGTHGKTSTTALMAEVLLAADLDPTISIGAHMVRTGQNYRVGNSGYFLLESCEYNNSYHHWHPNIAIILNIDPDHLDFFKTPEGVVQSFHRFAQNVKDVLIIQQGTMGFDQVTERLSCRVVTFGEEGSGASYQACHIEYDDFGRAHFDVVYEGETLGHLAMPMPGQYNMLNALASFAAGVEAGIAPDTIARALSGAQGAKRRFEVKGHLPQGTLVIDDYAHHPTEIVACLAAAKKAAKGKVYTLFQPHTYTRTRNHLEDFCTAFAQSDEVVLLPIYAAREPFDPTISSLDLLEGIRANGGSAIHLHTFPEAVTHLTQCLQPTDVLITMGAGDVFKVGETLLST